MLHYALVFLVVGRFFASMLSHEAIAGGSPRPQPA